MAKKTSNQLSLPKVPTILMAFFLFAGDIAGTLFLVFTGDFNPLSILGF